jgi:hypothetical protein
MHSKKTPKIILPHLNWSIERFKEAINKEGTEYYRSAALQRFGLTYKVALKAIIAFAIEEGENCVTDQDCFIWLKKKQWLENDSDWSLLIENYQSIKNQPEVITTNKIYHNLQAHYTLLKSLNERMNLYRTNINRSK